MSSAVLAVVDRMAEPPLATDLGRCVGGSVVTTVSWGVSWCAEGTRNLPGSR